MQPSASQTPVIPSEVSCLVPLDRIARGQASGSVAATPAQLPALAARLQVKSVAAFTFDYAFHATARKRIYRLEGHLHADLDQECVLTLDPVPGKISIPFGCLCGTASALEVFEGREDDLDEEPPEEITPDGIDVGELAIQYLALALDAYPRRADVSLPDVLDRIGLIQDAEPADTRRQQPFRDLTAVLKVARK